MEGVAAFFKTKIGKEIRQVSKDARTLYSPIYVNNPCSVKIGSASLHQYIQDLEYTDNLETGLLFVQCRDSLYVHYPNLKATKDKLYPIYIYWFTIGRFPAYSLSQNKLTFTHFTYIK